MAVSKISKLSGQAKSAAYPQPEGVLGEAMVKYGKSLGEEGAFGNKKKKKENTFLTIFWFFPICLGIKKNWLICIVFLIVIQFIARSLIEAGEGLKLMADVKYALEDNVKQNFLEPLYHLQNKDLKDLLVRDLK